MTIAKHSAVYLASGITNALIPFVLLPLLTRYLRPDDFGRLAIIEAVVAFSLPVVMMGVNGVTSIEYFKRKDGSFPSYISSALVIPVFMACGLCTVGFTIGNWMPPRWEVPLWIVALIPLVSLMQTVIQTQLTLHQCAADSASYAYLQIISIASNVGLSLLFVGEFDLGWEGRFLGILVSQTLTGLICIWTMGRRGIITPQIKRIHLRDALKTGAPLVLHTVGALVVFLSDRFFISTIVGLEAVGVYSVAYQIAASLSLLQTAFVQAWIPHLFRALEARDVGEENRAVRVGQAYLVGMLCAYGAVILLTPALFGPILNANYAGASQYVPWLGLGFLFLAVYKLPVNVIFFEKRTRALMLISISNIVSSVGLNVLLIMRFGAIGAAYANAASTMIFMVVTFAVAQRTRWLPWLVLARPQVSGQRNT
jgi:O-antigen/teichoic acid export membrane protein